MSGKHRKKVNFSGILENPATSGVFCFYMIGKTFCKQCIHLESELRLAYTIQFGIIQKESQKQFHWILFSEEKAWTLIEYFVEILTFLKER